MSEVAIYLFAPKRVGRRSVRKLRIEEATWNEDGSSYTPGRVLVDTEFPCEGDTPDECLTMRGQITGKM